MIDTNNVITASISNNVIAVSISSLVHHAN